MGTKQAQAPVSTAALIAVLERHAIAFEMSGPGNTVTGCAPLDACHAGDLVWSRKMLADPEALAASVFILPLGPIAPRSQAQTKTLFFVETPRDVFRTLLRELFSEQVTAAAGRHDTNLFPIPLRGADVRVADDVVLGQNVVLHPGVVIYPNVTIGDNVEVGAGCVIGAPGYSYVRQPDARLEHFPHVGGVVIGDDVTIGANSCVDSGGLGATRIGRGTKIGNLCQIAHNVEIGEDCLLAGRVQIGGGTKVGNQTEIWPSTIISHKLVIGAGCDIKIGSVVVQNLADGAVVSGNFAIPHEKSLRDLAKRRK